MLWIRHEVEIGVLSTLTSDCKPVVVDLDMHNFVQSDACRFSAPYVCHPLVRNDKRAGIQFRHRLLVDGLASKSSDAIADASMRDGKAEPATAADVMRPRDH